MSLGCVLSGDACFLHLSVSSALVPSLVSLQAGAGGARDSGVPRIRGPSLSKAARVRLGLEFLLSAAVHLWSRPRSLSRRAMRNPPLLGDPDLEGVER